MTAAGEGRSDSDRSAANHTLPAADAIVCVRGLTKLYRHPWTMRVTAGLRDATFDVRPGEIFGYLGPNGAGKTTTIKLLTGLLKPTGGNAWLMGRPIDSVASRASLGFLPEQPYFYDYLSGLEYLELVARLSGLTARDAASATRQWLGRVGLGGSERLVLRKYSKGMLQRLGLAAAMVHAPKLLILDEPMSGLDPFGRRDVRDLILEQRERGTTVMLSSHILPDVEALCDRVAIVLGGRIERTATLARVIQELVDFLVSGHFEVVEVQSVACTPHGRRLRHRSHTGQCLADTCRYESLCAPCPFLENHLRLCASHSRCLETQRRRHMGPPGRCSTGRRTGSAHRLRLT